MIGHCCISHLDQAPAPGRNSDQSLPSPKAFFCVWFYRTCSIRSSTTAPAIWNRPRRGRQCTSAPSRPTRPPSRPASASSKPLVCLLPRLMPCHIPRRIPCLKPCPKPCLIPCAIPCRMPRLTQRAFPCLMRCLITRRIPCLKPCLIPCAMPCPKPCRMPRLTPRVFPCLITRCIPCLVLCLKPCFILCLNASEGLFIRGVTRQRVPPIAGDLAPDWTQQLLRPLYLLLQRMVSDHTNSAANGFPPILMLTRAGQAPGMRCETPNPHVILVSVCLSTWVLARLQFIPIVLLNALVFNVYFFWHGGGTYGKVSFFPSLLVSVFLQGWNFSVHPLIHAFAACVACLSD